MQSGTRVCYNRGNDFRASKYKMSNLDEKSIVVAGLEFFDADLLGSLSQQHRLILVDRDPQRLEDAQRELPEIRTVRGDITSRLTWKELDADSVKHVISTIPSPEVNLEMLRLLRDDCNSAVPVMILVLRQEHVEKYRGKDVMVINPLELGMQYILRRLDKHVFRAAHIGLGTGELVEVCVRARSHLVQRRLSSLRPTQWRIAALYRDGRLILPTGNCRLQMEDRVILVGEPTVLESVASLLTQGTPQFPRQYGRHIISPLEEGLSPHLEELLYWHEHTHSLRIRMYPINQHLDSGLVEQVKKMSGDLEIGPVKNDFREVLAETEEMGLLVVPPASRFSLRLRRAYRECPRPMLVPRGGAPYQKILVSLNGPDPALALESGSELSRLMSLPFSAVFVTLPRELRGRDESDALKLRSELISDFESLTRKRIEIETLEGNPVKVTCRRLAEERRTLLIIVGDRNRPHSLMQPNVPYLIAARVRASTLIIPVEEPESE